MNLRIISSGDMAETVTVMGKKGCGKTTFVRVMCSALSPDKLLIYDPLGQYAPLSRYVPREDTRREFEAVAGKMYHRGNLFFVVEEAEEYYREGAGLKKYTRLIAQSGRNHGIGFMCITRRPQELKKRVLNLSDRLIIFKLEGWDIDYMDRFLRRRFTEELNAMMDWKRDSYQFYHYQDGKLTLCPPLKL